MMMRAFAILGVMHCMCLALMSDTIVAASAEQADVQSAVDAASNGDTVTVPAGTVTWSNRVWIANKAISVIGAGIGQTVITRTGSQAFYLSGGNNHSRVSGFEITIPAGLIAVLINDGVTSPTNFRIDHNKFIATSSSFGVFGWGTPGNRFSGLIDNNIFVNCKVAHDGEAAGGPTSGKGGYTEWASALDIGSTNSLYIEDNVFYTDTTSQNNCVDSNIGGRYVFRFNTITNRYIEAHSMQGSSRAVRLWEIYGNQLTVSAGWGGSMYAPFRIRGGTGVVFDNEISGVWSLQNVALDNVRSYEPRDPWGQCDGTSYIDGNIETNGYWCRDQIGRSTDAFQMIDTNTIPEQALAPAMIWSNIDPSDTNAPIFCAVINSSQDHIVSDRDYFDWAPGFDGSSGVGVGTKAEMEAITPTLTGVGFWVTDEADWNTLEAGTDGQLYQWDGDSWELYYTPYTYPHPLQSAGSGSLQDSLDPQGRPWKLWIGVPQ